MASTYSSLKIELIGTGDQSATWGNTTNINLGTAIEEAITGSSDVTFASADVTLTLSNTNTSQSARNLRLRLTGTTGGARSLFVPAIEKQYIVQNDTADIITIKNATGTGVAVPASTSAMVYNDGVNVTSVGTYTSSIIAPSITDTGLTSGRITYASTGGLLTDSASLTYDGTTLTSTKFAGAFNGTLGATTPSTVVATTINASGQIDSGLTNANNAIVFNSSAASTGAKSINLQNTGGTAVFGVEKSTGSYLVNGSTAYDAVINGSIGVTTGVAGTAVTRVSSTGLTLTGDLTTTGNTILGNASTDTVTVNGYMGVGGAASSSIGVYVKNTIASGTTQHGVLVEPTTTTATTAFAAIYTYPTIGSSASTFSEVRGMYLSNPPVLSGGAVITNLHGIQIGDQTRGTNNYGITSQVTSGTDKWNIYASGSADNYFAGNVGISATPTNFGIASYKQLVIGQASFMGRVGNVSEAYINTNTSATDTYLGNAAATRYTQLSGAHSWSIAPSGTAGNPITFTQAMTLDASGNLGIGTTTPNSLVEIAANNTGITTGAALNTLRFYDTDTSSAANQPFGAIEFYGADTSNTTLRAYIRASAESATVPTYLAFGTGTAAAAASERMRIDSAGNVGIGVTPSAWYSTAKAIEIGVLGNSIYGNGAASIHLTSNAYYGALSTYKYGVTGSPAGRYEITDGRHQWFNAPSGTAGSTATFTEAMRLDTSGNLGIGTASPNARLHISNSSDGTSVDLILANTFSAASSTDETTTFQGEFYQTDVSANRAAGYMRFGKSGDFSNNANASAYIAFATRNAGTLAEKMRIDSAGNIGINNTPSNWISSWKAIDWGANTAVIAGGGVGGAGTYILNNAYYDATLGMTYKTTYQAAYYQQVTGKHVWYTAPSGTAGTAITFTTAMTLNASGGLQTLNTIGVGNATPSTSGAGITFPATQSASTDANTLDDYEEGTWTPTIVGLTTAGTGTYTIQSGSYTKVGRLVTITCTVIWTAHTGTGGMAISGIPFAVGNIIASAEYTAVPEFLNMTMPASTTPIVALLNSGTNIYVYSQAVGSGTVTSLTMDAAANIYVSMTYQTA